MLKRYNEISGGVDCGDGVDGINGGIPGGGAAAAADVVVVGVFVVVVVVERLVLVYGGVVA